MVENIVKDISERDKKNKIRLVVVMIFLIAVVGIILSFLVMKSVDNYTIKINDQFKALSAELDNSQEKLQKRSDALESLTQDIKSKSDEQIDLLWKPAYRKPKALIEAQAKGLEDLDHKFTETSNSFNIKMNAIANSVTLNESKINQSTQLIAGLDATINNMHTSIAKSSASISDINSNIETIKKSGVSSDAKITALYESLKKIEQSFGVNSKEIENIKVSIENLRKTTVKQNEEITESKLLITGFNQKIDEYNSTISIIKAELEKIKLTSIPQVNQLTNDAMAQQPH